MDAAHPPAHRDPSGHYRRVLDALLRGQVPFLVGGAWALHHHTGIDRRSHDFDLFVCQRDIPAARDALTADGLELECFAPHWLWKVMEPGGEAFVDLIYSSGNGVAAVDEGWFRHAVEGELLGTPVRLCPVEEMVWSKSFIMERERFDGADVAHLLHDCGERLDWHRLLARFGRHWLVLLSHLCLFRFVYPGRRDVVPEWVWNELTARLAADRVEMTGSNHVCRGSLLSRSQYLVDLEERGYRDGRLPPEGTMSRGEVEQWTSRATEDDPGGAEAQAEGGAGRDRSSSASAE